MADKSGVSHSTINRIEAGKHKVTTENLKILAKYLKGVSYEELMAAAGYLGDEKGKKKESSDGYFAFADGGENWTEEEFEIAKATIRALREQQARNKGKK